MKKDKRRKRSRSKTQEAFVRGFVATALLASADSSVGPEGGRTRGGLRRALMGGMAIASGTAVAEALQEKRYSTVLVALAAGAAGMAIISRQPILDEASQVDENRVQEEKEQVQG